MEEVGLVVTADMAAGAEVGGVSRALIALSFSTWRLRAMACMSSASPSPLAIAAAISASNASWSGRAIEGTDEEAVEEVTADEGTAPETGRDTLRRTRRHASGSRS